MPKSRLVVVGGSGFHGRAVVNAARRSGRWRDVVSVARKKHRAPPGVLAVHGDLCDPSSLRSIVDGADCVINAGHVIRGHPRELEHVNAQGVSQLAELCHERSVRQFIEIGTAAVYGSPPYEVRPDGTIAVAPESSTSASRAVGEHVVLEHGGTVLRPHYVIGPGDLWTIPSLLQAMSSSQWPPSPCGFMTMVDVRDLAAAAVRIGASPTWDMHQLNVGIPGGVAVDTAQRALRPLHARMDTSNSTGRERLATLDGRIPCAALWAATQLTYRHGEQLWDEATMAWYWSSLGL